MPLISVIVPVYNVEPFLNRCVDSILAQTFTNFELILVDDGSPDNCGAICDEYAAKDSRIHVIHQKNGGLSAARNAGIDWAFANSDSQWLSFIDSDDWVHPCFLEFLYRAVQDNRTDISVCALNRVREYTKHLQIEYVQPKVLGWAEFYTNRGALAVCACNKLCAKTVFQGIRYPVGKLHEDDFITHKILCCAKNVAFLDSELYYYYVNESGITGSSFNARRMDLLEALEQQIQFAKEHSELELYVKRIKVYCSYLAIYSKLIKDSDSLSMPEKKDLQRTVRRKMRHILLGAAKKADISFDNSIWYYEIAFPKLMWIYWTTRAMLKKIQNNK